MFSERFHWGASNVFVNGTHDHIREIPGIIGPLSWRKARVVSRRNMLATTATVCCHWTRLSKNRGALIQERANREFSFRIEIIKYCSSARQTWDRIK